MSRVEMTLMRADGYGARDRPGVRIAVPTWRVPSVVRRFSAAIIAALLVVGVCAPASFGRVTGRLRARGAEGRLHRRPGRLGHRPAIGPRPARPRRSPASTRRTSSRSTRPNATWPAVKQAAPGRSLVVYMGHGNGWPSPLPRRAVPRDPERLRAEPDGRAATIGTHQYFGEDGRRLAARVREERGRPAQPPVLRERPVGAGPARRARSTRRSSGSTTSRPGSSGPVPRRSSPRRTSSPSYFVRAILGGGRSIQSAWQKSPERERQPDRLRRASRSPGYVAQMDPETATSGFERSIVMKAGLAPADVLAGASGSARRRRARAPLEPDADGHGHHARDPGLRGLTSAGRHGGRRRAVHHQGSKGAPEGPPGERSLGSDRRRDRASRIRASEVGGTEPATPAAADPAAPGTPLAPTPMRRQPPPRPHRRSWVREARSSSRRPSTDTDLVVPERAGDVVAPSRSRSASRHSRSRSTLPATPGRYRLTITLHDADGVAYDAATQALLPSAQRAGHR